MSFNYSKIRQVHLEITSRCNASCPMCRRNIAGGPVNPDLRLTELTLADVQQILPPALVSQLRYFYLCGNLGDPCVSRDAIPVLAYVRSINDSIRLRMSSNASARTTAWWAELGQLLNKPNDEVKFGLDGLEDTNHIYRRGTQWHKIMENVQAYIAAGGTATWQFIVFKHNEHQVEQARELSQSLGFKRFFVLRSGRWGRRDIDELEVINHKNQYQYSIYPPSDNGLSHPGEQQRQAVIDSYGSWNNFLDKVPIDCKSLRNSEIYVDHLGNVYPCCYLADRLGSLLDGDLSHINALQHPLHSIIEGEYFRRISDSWQCHSVSDGRLKTCALECNRDVAWDNQEGR